MKVKLTLSIDKEVKEATKRFAKENNLSVSAIVQDYLESLNNTKPKKYPRLIQEMIGIAHQGNSQKTYKTIKKNYLTKKYLND